LAQVIGSTAGFRDDFGGTGELEEHIVNFLSQNFENIMSFTTRQTVGKLAGNSQQQLPHGDITVFECVSYAFNRNHGAA
jgi:hypothetical protein